MGTVGQIVCSVCGGQAFNATYPVLWPDLINAWQLSSYEVEYIDAQQGRCCSRCGSNLRSIALAKAVLAAVVADGSLSEFVSSAKSATFKILEINEAGTLNPFLKQLPGHTFGSYPQVDMHALPYADRSFDLVIHSDTLEHVSSPLHALLECARVLKSGGAICYTVPVVIGRLTRSREGLPKSWHGDPTQTGDDWLVYTEFGADFWTLPLQAGFRNVSIFAVEFPAAISICAYV
ncbi:class I SAM-dependent methyltransferase [Methylobacterium iners]|uniref:Ubiquinone biosynthesis O-methyltransferase, mitochondrial n=1 Tax=Methylobacterium iners TaxID=418707 RepID=A0ABQ4S1A5_9HYPH|nr:class I SAM-dependent methyltransferase [Methylobacterium iners]GJD96646.1 Ubiquinone biosynthesis O-methyltransferase, mitochondrial [Methylobacterium iners]